MSGTICVARALWDDPDFPKETFSEREAWMWLIAEASWKPRRWRIGNAVYDLQRGQLGASMRYLADTWGWSKSRVHRFLDRLKDRDMIGTASGTAVTLITICNYDKYQFSAGGSGTGGDEEAGQQRDSSGTKQNKDEIRLVSSSSSSCAREDENSQPVHSAEIFVLTPEADSLYDQVIAAVGLQRSTLPTYWMPPGAIIHVNRWLALGLTAEEIIATARHNRAAHKDPPNGPKALDRAMQITASAKQMPDLLPIAAPSSAKGVRHDQSAQASDRNERMQRIILAAARGSTD